MAERSNNLDNFCAFPFGHTTVSTNGDFSVCCIHNTPKEHVVNINNNRFDQWNQSEYLQEVRTAFRNNQQHPGCHVCWQKEKVGQVSMRTRNLREYQILGVTEATEFPVEVEVQLGNLCNLKCLMCNEHESSGILAENIQLGINKYNQQDFHWSEQAFTNLQELTSTGLKVLSIRGGEPFYNKPLLDIIENLPDEACSRTMLHISTNATVWNRRWQQALKKFKLVRLMFSVDAVGDLYEYIRFQGQWHETNTNIDQMSTGSNIKSLVHCVVQNLNIHEIGQVIQWAKEKNLYLQLEPLNHPSWLTITNLPAPLKQRAISHLEQVLLWNLADHEKEFLTVCHSQLVDSLQKPFDFELWNTFQTQIGLRDRLRNNSYLRFLPT